MSLIIFWDITWFNNLIGILCILTTKNHVFFQTDPESNISSSIYLLCNCEQVSLILCISASCAFVVSKQTVSIVVYISYRNQTTRGNDTQIQHKISTKETHLTF